MLVAVNPLQAAGLTSSASVIPIKMGEEPQIKLQRIAIATNHAVDV